MVYDYPNGIGSLTGSSFNDERGLELTNKQIVKLYYYIEIIMITLILFSYYFRGFSIVFVLFFVLTILVMILKRVTYSRFKISKVRYYNSKKMVIFGRILIIVAILTFTLLDRYNMLFSWMLYIIAYIILEKPEFVN